MALPVQRIIEEVITKSHLAVFVSLDVEEGITNGGVHTWTRGKIRARSGGQGISAPQVGTSYRTGRVDHVKTTSWFRYRLAKGVGLEDKAERERGFHPGPGMEVRLVKVNLGAA